MFLCYPAPCPLSPAGACLPPALGARQPSGKKGQQTLRAEKREKREKAAARKASKRKRKRKVTKTKSGKAKSKRAPAAAAAAVRAPMTAFQFFAKKSSGDIKVRRRDRLPQQVSTAYERVRSVG